MTTLAGAAVVPCHQVLSAHLDVGVDTVLLPAPPNGTPTAHVYSLVLESGAAGGGGGGATSGRKVLLVNKKATAQRVDVTSALGGRAATAYVVDQTYTTQPSPRVEAVAAGGTITLPAFATAVVVGEGAPRPGAGQAR